MTKALSSMIRTAAIATVVTSVATAGTLAAELPSSAKYDAMMTTIHAKQAKTRAQLKDVVANLRAEHLNAHIGDIHAMQAKNRAQVTALIKRARDEQISPQLAAK